MTQTTTPDRTRPARRGRVEPTGVLTEDQVRAFVHEQLAAVDLDGRSVCVLVPDGTRSCPMPLLLGAVHEALHGRVTRLTVLVALGTHARWARPSWPGTWATRPGAFAERYPGVTVRNHEWWDPDTFVSVGTIGADRIAELSEGCFAPGGRGPAQPGRRRARRDAGRRARSSRTRWSASPAATSTSSPASSGQEVIDVSHWLGALITSARDHRHPGITPVRALIDEAAVAGARREARVLRRGAVRVPTTLHAMAFGEPRGGLGRGRRRRRRETHVRYLDAPVRRVLSLDPDEVPRHLDRRPRASTRSSRSSPTAARWCSTPRTSREVAAMHPRDRRDRLPLPGLLREAVGPVHGRALGRRLRTPPTCAAPGTYDESTTGSACRVTVTLATGIPADGCAR